MAESVKAADNLSRIVLGTAGLGGMRGRIDKEESIRTILQALDRGITILDTAPAYGDAEELVGNALQRWNGATPVISTKVGRLKSYAIDEGIYDYSLEGMERSVINSLETLGIQIIDVLFLHDPSAIPENQMENVLAQLQEFKRKGYTRKIGVGLNGAEQFMKYIAGVNFDAIMEFNCLDVSTSNTFDAVLPSYQAREVELYVASPLHMGLLGNKFEEYSISPPTWLDKENVERAKRIKKIADKHQLPLHSLAHRYLLSDSLNFKIVIGPGDSYILNKTISDISEGPLPKSLVEEIIEIKRSQTI